MLPSAIISSEGTTIAVRDVSLFVKIVGTGYPLVLMHGGPGLDYTTLSELEPLADQFTLIFYDHRGNGRSSGAVESMTWENLTADADALRQLLGFDEWAVLGHSFGGNVALEYALRYPRYLSRLVLADTCAESRWYQENAPEILRKRGYGHATVGDARRFYNGDLAPSEVNPIVRRFMREYFHRLGLLDLPHAWREGRRMKMRHEAHVFGFAHTLNGWTVMDRLEDIETPTLVIAGRDDFLFPPEHQAILADRLPNAKLEIIELAGHNPQMEQPAVFRDVVRGFLSPLRWNMAIPALAGAH